MPLAITIDDPCSHTGELVISGSSRTFIGKESKGFAHLGSTIADHVMPGPVPHPGPTIVLTADSGRTLIYGTKAAAADESVGSCGTIVSAKHTTRTFLSE